MKREADILDDIRQQLDRVKQELQGYTVYLFGSRATGKARERSDFDIGVYGRSRLPLKTFYRISDLLDEVETLCRIDWVDLHETSARFRDAALTNARVLHGQ